MQLPGQGCAKEQLTEAPWEGFWRGFIWRRAKHHSRTPASSVITCLKPVKRPFRLGLHITVAAFQLPLFIPPHDLAEKNSFRLQIGLQLCQRFALESSPISRQIKNQNQASSGRIPRGERPEGITSFEIYGYRINMMTVNDIHWAASCATLPRPYLFHYNLKCHLYQVWPEPINWPAKWSTLQSPC